MPEDKKIYVGLFVTCLADLFRPSVAHSAIALLRDAGCNVDVPIKQTCCGQPAYNTGAFAETRPLAKQVITQFADFDYLVAPSGSCAGMIKHHYPTLFEDGSEWQQRALELAGRTWELTSFLVDVLQYMPPARKPPLEKSVAYHDSCAGLRELGIKSQPRKLLGDMRSVEVTELQQSEVCCGFGGTFCVKMPEISEKMVTDKLEDALSTGADMLLGGDLGCLLNISGRAIRLGHTLEVRHVAEVLADQLDEPAIGEGEP